MADENYEELCQRSEANIILMLQHCDHLRPGGGGSAVCVIIGGITEKCRRSKKRRNGSGQLSAGTGLGTSMLLENAKCVIVVAFANAMNGPQGYQRETSVSRNYELCRLCEAHEGCVAISVTH